jgi:hypothetical protein
MGAMILKAAAGVLALGLSACAGMADYNTDDLCRNSSRCAPACGSVATGASPDCSPAENEGRTRG